MDTPGPEHAEARDDHGLLIPILPIEEGAPDAVAVAAWHLALSNMIGVEVSHDLLALWLFPSQGGVSLLAPAELARDQMPVPRPEPFLHQHDLYQLEERVRKAGYGSAIAVPVRGAHRDVGLALFADLDRGCYGIPQALRLHGIAHRLAPTFEALAAAPPAATALGAWPEVTQRNLTEVLARVAAEARGGPELLRMVSGVLQTVLPHERLEVVLPGAGDRWALLSGPGGRWGEGTDGVTPAAEGLLARKDPDGTLLIRDLKGDGLSWPGHGSTRALQRVRAVLGIELTVAGGSCGWLLLGGAAPSVFRPGDRDTLRRAAPLVALRVQGLRLGLTADAGQAQLAGLHSTQPRVARLAGLLAATSHWGEAARLFEREVCEALGYRALRFALRLGDDRVVTLTPGELRPMADLPREALGTSEVAPLLTASAQFLVYGDRGTDLGVPLRIAGRPIGALVCLGGAPATSGHPVTAVQQVADLIAPHLELLRRAALPSRGAAERPVTMRNFAPVRWGLDDG